jgi:hypothetical protein
VFKIKIETRLSVEKFGLALGKNSRRKFRIILSDPIQ